MIHSTYIDNPYLSKLQIEEIDKHKPNINWWRVYGLGETGFVEGAVYTDWMVDEYKHNAEKTYIGIDFGFTHPAAVITIKKDYENRYWVTDEWVHSNKTEAEIVEYTAMQRFNRAYPDAENASGCESLRRHGVNIRSVNKGKGSVLSGISVVHELLRQNRLFVLAHCGKVIQSFEMYSYKETKGEKTPDELPAHDFSDPLDAIRYVVASDANVVGWDIPKAHYSNIKKYGSMNTIPKFH